MGAGLGKSTALITDGRFSGASRGFIIGENSPGAYDILTNLLTDNIGHVVPEAREGELKFLLWQGYHLHTVAFAFKVALLRSWRTETRLS